MRGCMPSKKCSMQKKPDIPLACRPLRAPRRRGKSPMRYRGLHEWIESNGGEPTHAVVFGSV